MSEWKCGECGKIYTLDEFLKLEKVKLVESDIDPYKEHGVTPICDCGYRFGLDKWRLYDNIEIKTDKEYINVTVSTIDLELNHGFGKNIWYETTVFPGGLEGDKSIECSYENRYEFKEDAIKDHDRIVNLLKEGKYNIVDSYEDKKELILENNNSHD